MRLHTPCESSPVPPTVGGIGSGDVPVVKPFPVRETPTGLRDPWVDPRPPRRTLTGSSRKKSRGPPGAGHKGGGRTEEGVTGVSRSPTRGSDRSRPEQKGESLQGLGVVGVRGVVGFGERE